VPGVGTPPADASATTGQPAGSGARSGSLAPADLSGKWIALFGRTAGGSVVEAWKTGEALEFRRAGELIWIRKAGADPVAATYTLSGLQFDIKSGSAMNVGRDDEVGLMNVGRDDEVGLNKAGAPSDAAKAAAAAAAVVKKTAFRDGNYLALIGDRDDVMVYAKVPDTGEAAKPDISGNYTGSIMDKGPVRATFAWKENYLQADLDEGLGVFKGEFKNGYFVGPANGPGGSGLAAVSQQADGSLDGIMLPMPFNHMDANFDFHPGQ
jgi:hypothetical protein